MLTVRRATADDEARYLRWANDVRVRRHAVSTATIDADEHHRWFTSRLRDPSTLLLVVEHADEGPVGQVRLDRADRDGGEPAFEVTISLAATARGRGLAVPVLRAALDRSRAVLGDARLVAVVRPDNTASLRTFARCGFARTGHERRRGTSLVVLERPPAP